MKKGEGMSAPDPCANTIGESIRQRLNQARTQLIERNLRNKLVNCALLGVGLHG